MEQVENKKGQGSETGWFKELDVEGESGGVEGQEEGGGDAGGAGLHGRVQFTWWASRSGQVRSGQVRSLEFEGGQVVSQASR